MTSNQSKRKNPQAERHVSKNKSNLVSTYTIIIWLKSDAEYFLTRWWWGYHIACTTDTNLAKSHMYTVGISGNTMLQDISLCMSDNMLKLFQRCTVQLKWSFKKEFDMLLRSFLNKMNTSTIYDKHNSTLISVWLLMSNISLIRLLSLVNRTVKLIPKVDHMFEVQVF